MRYITSWWVPLLVGIISYLVLSWSNPAFVQSNWTDKDSSVMPQPYYIETRRPPELPVGRAIQTLYLRYVPGQNSFITLELDNSANPELHKCVDKVWLVPQPAPNLPPLESVIISNKPFCGARNLYLGQYLVEGINRIDVMVTSMGPMVELYASPKLIGPHWLSKLACVGLLVAAAMVVYRIARNAGLNRETACIAIAGMTYYALWLWWRPELEYIPDLPGHIAYTQFMARNWLINPYYYTGHENFHPPTYYWLAARVYNLCNMIGVINPLLGERMLGLALYMIFCIYALRTLDEAVEKKDLAYYMGCLLIMFWPVSINTATNFSNDLATYPVWGASFYYLARGIRLKRLACLQAAIVLTGVAFMVKSNALVVAGINGSCILYALYRKQFQWRQFLQPKSIAALSVIPLGLAVNMGRMLFTHFRKNIVLDYLGTSRNDIYPPSYYFSFNLRDMFVHPFAQFLSERSYLNYFLKTWLYSPFTKLNPPVHWLPPALNGLLIVLLLVIIVGTFVYYRYRQDKGGEHWVFVVAVLMSLAGDMGFTVVERYQHCQNFRYVLPMMVPLVVLFVRAMETANKHPHLKPFYWLGIVVGNLLPAGAVFLYLARYI